MRIALDRYPDNYSSTACLNVAERSCSVSSHVMDGTF